MKQEEVDIYYAAFEIIQALTEHYDKDVWKNGFRRELDDQAKEWGRRWVIKISKEARKSLDRNSIRSRRELKDLLRELHFEIERRDPLTDDTYSPFTSLTFIDRIKIDN